LDEVVTQKVRRLVEGETKIVGKTSKDRREKCPFSTQIQGKYLEKERNAQNDMENKCPPI
jgi:hypothetical protein